MALPSETLGDRVSNGLYSDILSRILTGEYPPNSTLPTEFRLGHDYGVSRSVVRSALKLLKQEGIVQSQQGSGTIVVGLAPDRLAQLHRDVQMPALLECIACRLAIEPEIAAQLAEHQTEGATTYLRIQRDGLEGRLGNDFDTDSAQSASDAEFHVKLAQLTGNVFFSEIMISMRPHMVFCMNIKNSLTRAAHQRHLALTRQEHRDVISAILSRDADAARTRMRNHIANGRDRVF
jgi:GntR family transcriptional regulator, transcriptional repressor for pyruvate dehydrogenase complex